MVARLRSSAGWITTGALLVVGVAVAIGRVGDAEVFISFACMIAVSELFEVVLPNEAPHSLGLAPGLGLALLPGHSTAEVTLAFAAGAAGAIALRAVFRRSLRVDDMATHTIALTAATAVYVALENADRLPAFGTSSVPLSALGLAGVFLTILLTQATLRALRAVDRDRIPFMPVFRGQLSSTAALQLSILSVGALLALSYPRLQVWSFPLFLAPLAATQFAFRQFASIRKTYLQTIRALSKVPEMAGYTMPGHSTRVAELSVSIARELGTGDGDVSEIEYAALLHDIGRVSIPDPAEPDHGLGQDDLAAVGANIVRETGHFPRVAEMIARQHEPYRHRGENVDGSLSIGAKIIKVASAYDDLTRPGGIGLSAWDALERLHLGMAYEYDPQVIQGLTRVLEKRGSI